jgi:hypothetical protein
MSRHLFRAAHSAAAVAVLTAFIAQGAAALPPRSAPPHPTPPEKPAPDLTFRSAWAQVSELPGHPPVHTGRVPAGHALAVCFVVTNAGSAQSGPYRVTGGNFGTPTIQSRNETGLAPGGSHQDCLGYDAPRRSGPYQLELVLSSQHGGVAKTSIPIVVFPRFGGQYH